jgi:flagellar protein FliJ
MTQTRILKSAHDVLERQEQRHAQALATSERQVKEHETKLAELERYRADYIRDFGLRAEAGISGEQVRTYQSFIARLAQAVREQQEVLARARAAQAEELRKWRLAARRTAALGRVVGRRDLAARQRTEKGEQAAADAHAQRRWATKGTPRGN